MGTHQAHLRCGQVKHEIYRCFDGDGNLLYIGRTKALKTRISSHVVWSEWWTEVRQIARTPGLTKEEAILAERLAIRSEHPKHNVQHNVSVGGWITVTVKLPEDLRRKFRMYVLGKGLTMQAAMAEMIRRQLTERSVGIK